MVDKKKVIALIPARGGSKKLPYKNIRELAGKPLIAWTIQPALQSKFIDEVVVSTDSREIADISAKFGAHIPCIRPLELSGDNSKMMDVLFHCVDFFERKQKKFDILVLLQPTSPLRTVEDIDGGIDFFINKKAKAVIGVTENEHPVEWIGRIPDDLSMGNFLKKKAGVKNRQEFGANYRVNGSLYVADMGYLRKNNDWYGNHTYAYIMKQDHSVDIDNLVDFEFAEFLLNRRK